MTILNNISIIAVVIQMKMRNSESVTVHTMWSNTYMTKPHREAAYW